jgi:flagellin
MAMVINTNMGALNATRLLGASSNDQSVAMERLTSGMRINSAADDAAGLAVASKMSAQIRGTDMAVRNVNDGISMAQTIDGAAEEIGNMLQRQRELTVQGTNGTYSATDVAAMQAEYNALALEVTRIGNTTKFNGVNIMDGTAYDIQAGWEGTANDVIAVTTIDASAYVSAGAVNDTANLAALDGLITGLNTDRSAVGAVQNRLEYTVSNLQNVSENISAARSQIMDADFAKESAELARTQVLQQAGMSMLSQANQQSQNVLQLLQ